MHLLYTAEHVGSLVRYVCSFMIVFDLIKAPVVSLFVPQNHKQFNANNYPLHNVELELPALPPKYRYIYEVKVPAVFLS